MRCSKRMLSFLYKRLYLIAAIITFFFVAPSIVFSQLTTGPSCICRGAVRLTTPAPTCQSCVDQCLTSGGMEGYNGIPGNICTSGRATMGTSRPCLCENDPASRRSAFTCNECVTLCVGNGGMRSYNSINGSRCTAAGAADPTSAAGPTAAGSQCFCGTDGATAQPVSGSSLVDCCTACRTPQVRLGGAPQSCTGCRCHDGTQKTEAAAVASKEGCCTACQGRGADNVLINGTNEQCRREVSPTEARLQSFNDPFAGAEIPQIIGGIIKSLFGVIGALFLAFFVYGGARYMLAMGDTKAVDEAKKTLVRAVTGIAIVLFSYSILSVVLNVASGGIESSDRGVSTSTTVGQGREAEKTQETKAQKSVEVARQRCVCSCNAAGMICRPQSTCAVDQDLGPTDRCEFQCNGLCRTACTTGARVDPATGGASGFVGVRSFRCE